MPIISSPYIATITGALLISFSGIWVAWSDVEPLASAFYRVFFGSCFLLPAVLYTKSLKIPNLFLIKWFSICGFIFALDLFLWHLSIKYIGPGLATVLGNFQVFILTAIGLFFYGEKIRTRFLLAVPLAITGLFLVVDLPDGLNLKSTSTLGIILGLLTAICYSAFLLSLKKIQQAYSFSLFYNLLIISLATSLFLGVAMSTTNTSFSLPTPKSVLSLLALALFSQTVGWTLIANAMPKIRTSLTGFILLLQPSLAFVWDVLFFSRPTSLANWAGVFITLTAIYMGITGKQK